MARLLDMPPEVLYNIYDWLRLIEDRARTGARTRQKAQPRTWQPVCRALRPYTQAYRFHKVTISNHETLAKFAAAVADAPSLGAAGRVVVLDHRYAMDWAPPSEVQELLAEVWMKLGCVRSVMLKKVKGVLDALFAAVEGGMELPLLGSLEVTKLDCSNPYGLAKWRAFLAAAPKLNKVAISFEPEFVQSFDDPVLPVVPGPAFATRMASLRVTSFPATHELALAAFVNAFPALDELNLSAGTEQIQPQVLSLVQASAARKLGFQWRTKYGVVDAPLGALDLRRFPLLEEVGFASGPCAPSFRFHLPPRVRRLTIGMSNNVPLDALIALVTPGKPSHAPTLKRIRLDLPFAHAYGSAIEHMTIDEMAELEINDTQTMRWTREVSREKLMDLIVAAEEQGVEVTGTCRVAIDFEQAVMLRHEEEDEADGFGAVEHDSEEQSDWSDF